MAKLNFKDKVLDMLMQVVEKTGFGKEVPLDKDEEFDETVQDMMAILRKEAEDGRIVPSAVRCTPSVSDDLVCMSHVYLLRDIDEELYRDALFAGYTPEELSVVVRRYVKVA